MALGSGRVLAAALGWSLGPASAQQSQNRTWCVNRNNAYSPDLAISGCTALIHSGRECRKCLAVFFYNRGIAYDDKKEYDRAIADYNEAIRLNPKHATAFNNRCASYNDKGDHDLAVADCNEAIRLNPKHAAAFTNRGIAYRAKGDLDRAIADYNEAIRLDPKLAAAYLNRGLAYLYSGSLAKAQADFKQASELTPKDANAALWLEIAERRNNIPSHLARAKTQLDMKAWPAPVIRLFLGELTPTAVLAAADDPDPEMKQGQVCQANFFSGELALLDGSKQEAARLFRIAANDCPSESDERFAANAELKALGLEP